jgi:hypothetical protein
MAPRFPISTLRATGITAYLENGGTLQATKPYNHYYLALTS